MNEPIRFCNSADDSKALADPDRWVEDAVARCGERVNHAAYPDWQAFCTAAARLLAYQGLATLDDPKRMRNALNDHCKGAFKREVNVSILCASADILAQCARHSGTVPSAFHIRRMVTILTDEHGVAPDLADFIAGVWSTLCWEFHDPSPRDYASSSAPSQPVVPAISTPSHKAGDTHTVDLGGGVNLEMVWCPPGNFIMGSPPDEFGRSDYETQHRVTLTQGFWIGQYEVTQAQWMAVMMGINPSYGKNAGTNAPVEHVSWDDCQGFVRKMNTCVSRGGYRLPTEAEWEYACRAGTTGPYAGNLDDMAWYGLNSDSTIHPVGQKKPNAWGLYDMHGNVFEWCQDWYGEWYGKSNCNCESGSVTDPSPPGSRPTRVIRGGCWVISNASYCRSAYRGASFHGRRSNSLGLRLARNAQ
jgi:formylglycine-generating enzyme required for sulfatase activity